MARAKKRTPEVEELRPYVEGVAKNLVEKLYGPQGPAWGTKLTEIEDVLLEIREVLTGSGQRGGAAVACRPTERRGTADGLLATAAGGGHRTTSLPPNGLITNHVGARGPR